MIEEIWELLSKLTNEAHQTALAKCIEYSIDPNSGIISLDESYINLNWSCNTLKDAIEKNKLNQLPLTIQSEVHETLKTIVANHEALIAGTNAVDALSKTIEKLFTDVWRYGLNNISDEQLGYLMKLNQLKEIESSIIATKEIRSSVLGHGGRPMHNSHACAMLHCSRSRFKSLTGLVADVPKPDTHQLVCLCNSWHTLNPIA